MRKERRELFAAQQALLTEGLARNAAEARATAAESQVAWWKNVAKTADKHRMEMMAERDEAMSEVVSLRDTVSSLNRRCQSAESAATENVDACRRAGVSLGRSLANWAAAKAEEKVAAYIKLVGQSSTQYRELVQALDAAKTVLSDIYKREGKSWHGSRVKADIESIMPAIGAALAKEGVGG